jgi:hypothetical protein
MLRQKVGKLHDWVGRQWGCARGNGGGAGGRRRGRRRTVAWGVRGRVDKAEVCSAAVRRVVGGGGGGRIGDVVEILGVQMICRVMTLDNVFCPKIS